MECFLKKQSTATISRTTLSKYKYGKRPPVDIFKIVKPEGFEIYGCDFNDVDSMRIGRYFGTDENAFFLNSKASYEEKRMMLAKLFGDYPMGHTEDPQEYENFIKDAYAKNTNLWYLKIKLRHRNPRGIVSKRDD